MREHPILFSGEMVRAILDGRKTQTRRVIVGKSANNDGKPIATCAYSAIGPSVLDAREFGLLTAGDQGYETVRCPYGSPGDVLWVRETWGFGCGMHGEPDILSGKRVCTINCINYRADTDTLPPDDGKWRPSIHMPRWASRIMLEVVSVRVERVHDISEEDAVAEGASHTGCDVAADEIESARDHFCRLWDRINEARGSGWSVNPWVWVIEFKRINNVSR